MTPGSVTLFSLASIHVSEIYFWENGSLSEQGLANNHQFLYWGYVFPSQHQPEKATSRARSRPTGDSACLGTAAPSLQLPLGAHLLLFFVMFPYCSCFLGSLWAKWWSLSSCCNKSWLIVPFFSHLLHLCLFPQRSGMDCECQVYPHLEHSESGGRWLKLKLKLKM